jgi:hypothetical protein
VVNRHLPLFSIPSPVVVGLCYRAAITTNRPIVVALLPPSPFPRCSVCGVRFNSSATLDWITWFHWVSWCWL